MFLKVSVYLSVHQGGGIILDSMSFLEGFICLVPETFWEVSMTVGSGYVQGVGTQSLPDTGSHTVGNASYYQCCWHIY